MMQMDFENSGVEVTQEEMCLEDSGQTDSIPMNMDIVQEQSTLMEGGSEEVIVSDFISDQFGFQEYSVQTENTSGANVTIEANQLGDQTSQHNQIIGMQYVEQSKPSSSQTGIISIKAIHPQRAITKKSAATAPFPRQVAIAPKPTKGAPNVQYAIAPKPVTFMMNKGATGPKTVSMKSVVQNLKGNTVLAQIGKQLVMMPAGAAGQKLKLASVIPGASTDATNIQLVRDSAQLISNKAGKPVKTKLIIQGQPSNEPAAYQPAVLTKIVPVSTAAPTQTRYIMQQKTVPISIGGNKVILTSPTKQAGVKIAPKKQIISIKAENPRTVTSQANIQTKKIVITANPAPSQLKTTAVKTTSLTQGQRTQLHPINVPGKGIQYIKLVTNQPPVQKPATKPQTISVGGKNFVLTDSKGNIIQMTADKVLSTQPPPLLVTTNTTNAGNVATKARKLVRIAPVTSKSDTSVATPRAPQSLLMPRKQPPVITSATVSLEEFNEMVEQSNQNTLTLTSDETVLHEETVLEQDEEMETQHLQEPIDVKPTLASLISDAVSGEPEPGPEPEPEPEPEAEHGAGSGGGEEHLAHVEEVEIEYERTPRKQEYFPEDENTNSVDELESTAQSHDENLIIVPSSIPTHSAADNRSYHDESNTSVVDNSKMSTMVSVEADVMPYLSPDMEQSYSDAMLLYDSNSTMRPRKACNCTKSQCLKLYCDCFANGEFCNQCNCNNCHNNLDHEDTRQKAIRACLERNPNAFRPKIGKSKTGGPEIVRRHNKGCNCKRSGCLKNYCECYEAKIACTLMCKCVGCRNIEETIERRRDAMRMRERLVDTTYRQPLPMGQLKQPCNFLTREVIEAVAQCMLATVSEEKVEDADAVEDILLEFSRCMADIISASHQAL